MQIAKCIAANVVRVSAKEICAIPRIETSVAYVGEHSRNFKTFLHSSVHGMKTGPVLVCPGTHKSLGPSCAAMCTEKVPALWVLFGFHKLRHILVLQNVKIEHKLCG